jgi:hypothetical protein
MNSALYLCFESSRGREEREHCLAHLERLGAQVGVSEHQQGESEIMRTGSDTGQLCEIRAAVIMSTTSSPAESEKGALG